MWHQAFNAEPNSPATDDEILEFARDEFAPLSDDEVRELMEEHKRVVGDGHFDPPFDPEIWPLPEKPLPKSYLDFLRFSNGGYFEGRHRDFDPLFSTHQVREYLLAYSIPHWMPQTCPIGFDGGGTFYLLDMRAPPVNDDYPILFASASCLSFESDDSPKIANSFAELVASGLGE